MKKKVLGYKVRNKTSGLFLSSLASNKWTKIGKTWPRRGDVVRALNVGLKNLRRYEHLKVNFYQKALDDMPNWEVVELTEENSFSVLFLIDKLKG
tara:strand:+ start:638 stop:922 length:285 start_codon:yes stop_codon:yes gene_type:complete